MSSYRALTRLLFAALLVHVGEVQAQSAPQGLTWHCAQLYDEQFHVRCMPQREADNGSPADEPQAAAAARTQLPAHAGDLRPLAQRGDSVIFGVGAWHVPLYALPLDEAMPLELLRAVFCGKANACQVHYAFPQITAFGSSGSAPVRRRK